MKIMGIILKYIDYGLLFKVKYSVLRKAYNNFKNIDNIYLKEEFNKFAERK